MLCEVASVHKFCLENLFIEEVKKDREASSFHDQSLYISLHKAMVLVLYGSSEHVAQVPCTSALSLDDVLGRTDTEISSNYLAKYLLSPKYTGVQGVCFI